MIGRYEDHTLSEDTEIPAATPSDTVDHIVTVSRRTGKGFPLRRTFLQITDDNGDIRPAPLAPLVAAGDRRALLLLLLVLTRASAPPWDAALPAAVWARALGPDLPQSKTATSRIENLVAPGALPAGHPRPPPQDGHRHPATGGRHRRPPVHRAP